MQIKTLFLNLRSVIFKKNGSAAIILSLIVSGAVLSTIFLTQKTANWFLSDQKSNIEEWKLKLVSKTALTIGGYAVSSNLILCKEGGWSDRGGNDGALCRWNDKNSEDDPVPRPADFKLKNEEIITNAQGRKTLSYVGNFSEMVENEVTSEILKNVFVENIFKEDTIPKFRISFDLVNWKDTNIRNLIGDIPNSICRDKISLEIVEGYCGSHDQNKCRQGSKYGPAISNTICENISEMDQDSAVVLMSVKVPADGDGATVTYAGIRRPLAVPIITLSTPPVCRLSCASSNSGAPFSECRGNFIPNSERAISDLTGHIYNPGPGPIYSLLIAKWKKMIVDGSVTKEIIGDLVTMGDRSREVIMPGERVLFQDYVNCEDKVNYYFKNQYTTGKERREVESNMHAQPLLTISYYLGSMKQPTGACMTQDENGLQKGIEGTCTGNIKNQVCGDEDEGRCKYSYIEPARTIKARDNGTATMDVEAITSIVVRHIVPH